MKQLLKPTGQILTTAVVTSTAIDAHFPQPANPLSVESAAPETIPVPERPTIDASDVSGSGETVAPPEAVPTHSALPGQLPSGRILQDERLTPLPPESFVDQPKTSPVQEVVAQEAVVQEVVAQEVVAQEAAAQEVVAQEAAARSLALPTTQVFLPEASATIPPATIPSATVPEPDIPVSAVAESDSAPSNSPEPDIASSMPLPTELPTELPAALTEAPIELPIELLTEPPAELLTEFPSDGPQGQDSVRSAPASSPPTFHPSSPDVPVVNQQWLEPSRPDPSISDEEMADRADLTMPLTESTVESVGDDRDRPIDSISSIDIVDGAIDADIVDGAIDADIEATIVDGAIDSIDIVDGAIDADIEETIVDGAIDSIDIVDGAIDADIEATVDGAIDSIDIVDGAIEADIEATIVDGAMDLVPSEDNPEIAIDEPDSDKLQETRDWLDDQLATIVDQSRQRQAHQNRQQLIDYARRSLELGNIAEARQVAENSVLSEEERNALSVAIDEAAVHEFLPLIPLDNTYLDNTDNNLNRIGIQPTSPAWDALPTLPTTPLNPPNPLQASSIIASSSERLPSLPLNPSGLHQWPLTGLPTVSSLTAEELRNCLVGDADLQLGTLTNDGLGREPIGAESVIRNAERTNRVTMEPMSYIGTGQQPPSGLKTSDAFPVGANFLAGVGQQPPSILPESSWSGSPVLSADPVPLKWTRSRLNQELDAIATTPKTLSPECDEALSSRNHPTAAHTGGRTVASLTGYEWLSQYALPRPESAQQQHRPLHMILPLPHAVPMTSGFGWRSHPIYGDRRFHFGLDYGAPMGTPILASIPGRIQSTGSLKGYGLTVVLENNDVEYRNLYAHMSGIAVEEGTWVDQGTVIGWVGSTGNSTGPHLHFEVHKQSPEGWVAIDPLQAAAEIIRLAQR